MPEQVLIQFSIDKDLRQEVANIYESLGMDLNTAFRMFLIRSKWNVVCLSVRNCPNLPELTLGMPFKNCANKPPTCPKCLSTKLTLK